MNIQISPTFLPESHASDLVIFCVGQDLRRVAAFRSWAVNRRISVCPLIGSYRGITERSFVVRAADFSEVAPWTEAEESVLRLGPTAHNGARLARLEYATGSTEDLGAFVACSREMALGSLSWTYDPAAQRYFICTQSMDQHQGDGALLCDGASG